MIIIFTVAIIIFNIIDDDDNNNHAVKGSNVYDDNNLTRSIYNIKYNERFIVFITLSFPYN